MITVVLVVPTVVLTLGMRPADNRRVATIMFKVLSTVIDCLDESWSLLSNVTRCRRWVLYD